MNSRHRDSILLLFLWILLIFWLRPWSGDLKSDPLAYACIAKDMVENNNYLNPVLDGKPYLNKPPLYFWLVSLSFKIFGINFYASKVPALVFGTLDVFLLYFIVYRWTGKIEFAFLSSLVLTTTRWIFRDFTTNRPESLLVFSILIGCYAIILMNERRRSGYYLLGLSFFIGVMCKFLFAVFTPLTILIFGFLTARIKEWMKSPHLYISMIVTLAISSIWFIYYESIHRGYIIYLFKEQVLQRIQEGGDVKRDHLMYFREFLLYYHPWLIVLIGGIPGILRRIKKEEILLFSVIGFLVVFIPLQVSHGKASRYLIPLSPFLSILVADSIINMLKLKDIILRSVKCLILPLFVFFWVVPLRINPEKYQVVHLAKLLSHEFTLDYRDPFASIRRGHNPRSDIKFVFWAPYDLPVEQERVWYFYLRDTFAIWNRDKLNQWINDGDYPVIILTYPEVVKDLKYREIRWLEIAKDRYNILLGGVKTDLMRR